MKNIIHYITKNVIWISLVTSHSAFAAMNLESWYFGIDFGIKQNGFILRYGDNLFKKKQPLINISVGVEVIPNLNIEIHAQKNIQSNQVAIVPTNEFFLGHHPRICGCSTYTYTPYNTNTRISSFGIDLIYKFNRLYYENFNLLFGIGMELINVNLKVQKLQTGNVYKLNKNNTRALTKLSCGLEYMFTENYSIRSIIGWENTSVVQPKRMVDGIKTHEARFRNSLNYTLGITYSF